MLVMTDKQFLATKWKPFETVTVFLKEFNRFCMCYVVGIDFEERIMKVRPLDVELYEDDIYDAPINIITRGEISKLKIVK